MQVFVIAFYRTIQYRKMGIQWVLFIVLILVISISMVIPSYRKEGFETNTHPLRKSGNTTTVPLLQSASRIPKIVHQTAPRDTSKWHKVWFECQKTWKKYFPEPEYEYKMWYDEDLENLIRTDYPWFLNIYLEYDKPIKRFDIARYFIMHKYGGIYADMDYMCTQNFYDMLHSFKISISESPYKNNEHIQNALMISPPGETFWISVVDEASKSDRIRSPNILYSTGPKLLSDVYFLNEDSVDVLPYPKWNPHNRDKKAFNNKSVITKHIGTAVWWGE